MTSGEKLFNKLFRHNVLFLDFTLSFVVSSPFLYLLTDFYLTSMDLKINIRSAIFFITTFLSCPQLLLVFFYYITKRLKKNSQR